MTRLGLLAGLTLMLNLAPADASVEVCFEPGGPCESQIVAAIDGARAQIRMQAYQFTAWPVARALIAASARGVDVQVLLDRSNERGGHSRAGAIQVAGIPVWVDYLPAVAHDKTIVIDSHLVIGGSYNYTASASHRNAENVLFIDDPAVAAQFLTHWSDRRAVSRPWGGDATQ